MNRILWNVRGRRTQGARMTHVTNDRQIVVRVNAERYDNACAGYTEIGVTFCIAKDWARASADAWFRVDEVVAA